MISYTAQYRQKPTILQKVVDIYIYALDSLLFRSNIIISSRFMKIRLAKLINSGHCKSS